MTLWVAVGLAAVAIIAVSLAGWQLVKARRQAQQIHRLALQVRDLSTETQHHAGHAAEADQSARDQARWAWEQVKLANTQLEQAQQDKQASTQAEQWEWAYALTMAARELVDASTELVRIGLDTQVAPHYRQAANRHYRQSCQRWQDTMIKALSRTSPSLEVQHQLIAFGYVHQRLHGHIDVLLRSVETDTLSEKDPVAQGVHALRHELANVHRQFQRTISASLATVGDAEIHDEAIAEPDTRSISAPAPEPPTQVGTPPAPRNGSRPDRSQPSFGSNGRPAQASQTHAAGTPNPGTPAPAGTSAPAKAARNGSDRTAASRPPAPQGPPAKAPTTHARTA
ncbi:hypothetical protein BJF85_03110 [Saccharomonospora sp. CUA-673]|uniref:proline-rich domain-containing protein n=1 Tax=Saccharomonospora sp. CUA-673 TaxID=1904969 RepID=UPI0009615FE6|nr:hypothetical protein [Saccharomonospora sp. CUA-673]OLT43086.1 hypothetical protein BJF85_03110 [Saccharomonospora sp. CUA-673]